MAPYFCHTHNGLYQASDTEEGCQDEECIRFRALDIPPLGMMPATVPGGANDTESYRFKKNFDRGLDEYREARRHGIQPKSTLHGAVEEAEKQVYDQAEALHTLETKYEADTSKLPTAKGVR
jgi:hypothetical protein